MKISLSLLVTPLLASAALAAPIAEPPENIGMIHLPLKRLHNLERKDIHPQVLYQQHVNRGLRRLARITKRAMPSDEELYESLSKRMYIPKGGLPKLSSAHKSSSTSALASHHNSTSSHHSQNSTSAEHHHHGSHNSTAAAHKDKDLKSSLHSSNSTAAGDHKQHKSHHHANSTSTAAHDKHKHKSSSSAAADAHHPSSTATKSHPRDFLRVDRDLELAAEAEARALIRSQAPRTGRLHARDFHKRLLTADMDGSRRSRAEKRDTPKSGRVHARDFLLETRQANIITGVTQINTNDLFGGHHHGAGGNAGAGAGGGNGGAGAGAGAGNAGAGGGAGAGNAGAGAGAGNNAGDAGNSTSTSTSAGFSDVDLEAASENTVADSDVQDGNDTTGLDIQANDVGYFAKIQIGTPPQDFLVIMDSGSSDFWVQADKCNIIGSTTPCSAQHQTLGTASSSTLNEINTPFSVTYGTGQVEGNLVTDNVVLAQLPLAAHTFGVATQETDDFGADDVPTDGLMGLAQKGLSQQGVSTPVESLAAAGKISAPITSFKISRLADDLNDGQVTFGGLDTSKFDQATLVTVPNVNKDGFWEGAVDSFTVNGQDLGLKGRTAILDTGTTLIVAPPSDAAAVHAAIPGAKSDGQGGFTVPCTTTASVALTFGGQSFAIDPRDITFLPVDPNDLTGDCQSGISAGQIGGATEWLVGDVFLKNAYFSTDESKNTVSLAKLT